MDIIKPETGWGMKKSFTIIIIFIFALYNNLAQTKPPISPKWVFEPWVWEDEDNTETAANNLINEYTIINDIPVGAIIIDSPWEEQHTGNYDEETNNGYNTFIFNQTWYNNPYDFIHNLSTQDIHVILWITGVIDEKCTLYNEIPPNYFVNGGAIYNTWWKGSGNASLIDFFNDTAVHFWEGLMDQILDNYEVDGWKVDESDHLLPDNEMVNTSKGLKTKKEYSNAYYSEMYNYIHREDKRGSKGMIMARPYCDQHTPYYYAPVSVNTAGWVGDQYNTWDGIMHAINNVFISADSGYAAIGFDIGGYQNEYNDPDRSLFLRWGQLGALVPIMENGGNRNNCHRPWLFNRADSTTDIYRYFATLHHELVPYLYSYDIEAHSTGTSIVRPVGKNLNDWVDSLWEYRLGDNLLISTIYDENNNNSKTIYFPEGYSWIDYWNDNNVYQGGTPATLTYSERQYPIFIRKGAIIPLNVDDTVTHHGSGSLASKNFLTLLIYPDGLSSFQYNIDPSNSTTITCEENGSNYTISFSKSTDSVIIRLKNNIEPANVGLNGENLVKYNSFSDFETAPNGWFHGKIKNNENIYTWIKFSNSANIININTSSISGLHPTKYELSSLNIGNQYYIDRPLYTLTDIPPEYQGLSMIKTANDDKRNPDLHSDYFYFTMNKSADIYIAYDPRLTIPSWMTTDNYINTGKTISVSDRYIGHFDIYKRTVQPGVVNFYNLGIGPDSSMYFVFYKPLESVSINIKVFLQGPYAGSGLMSTSINSSLPTTSPYQDINNNSAYLNGSNYVVVPYSIPSDITDWVQIEIRNSDGTTVVESKSCFLRDNGQVIDPDGLSENISLGSSVVNPLSTYYIVVKHRNHLAVMSSDLVELNGLTSYDFTTNGSAQGTNPEVTLSDGNLAMWAGDVNGDEYIDGDDVTAIFNAQGSPGNYLIQDLTDDNYVDGDDVTYTFNNQGNSGIK